MSRAIEEGEGSYQPLTKTKPKVDGHERRMRHLERQVNTNTWLVGFAFVMGLIGVAALGVALAAWFKTIPLPWVCGNRLLTVQGVCDNVTWSPTIGAMGCKQDHTTYITVPKFSCVSLNTSSGVGALYSVLPQAFRPDIDYGQSASYFTHVTHNFNATTLDENPLISFVVSWLNSNSSAPASNFIDVIAGAAGAPSSPVLEMGVNLFALNNDQLVPNSASGNFGPNHAITLGPYYARSSSNTGKAVVSLVGMAIALAIGTRL